MSIGRLVTLAEIGQAVNKDVTCKTALLSAKTDANFCLKTNMFQYFIGSTPSVALRR